ncbi:RNA methyltransferase [bacterium]|nr:RNA methyltransferase [bacterium]
MLVKIISMSLRKLAYDEIKMLRSTPEELASKKRFPIYGVLENIRSMYNVGAAFRTSDAACVQELILCGYTAQPPRSQIEKTALGATETVPWRHFNNTLDSISYLKDQGITVVALEHCEESKNLFTTELPFPVALLVGNEVDGLNEETVARCDMACEIPMFGSKQSLNAAVAYGIAVFELTRKYLILSEKKG